MPVYSRLLTCLSNHVAHVARELVELELHLAMRAKGVLIEPPGVRP